jgi:catechol 2,3-dioxygenase-like lactoylglutathione lyase family enzyme
MTASTQLVTGVDFVSVPTKDLAAARGFYGDVLGLEPSKLWQRTRAGAPRRGVRDWHRDDRTDRL